MPAYDAIRFAPAAPTALVTLCNAGSGIMVPDVPMLLDSGADVTLVPLQSVLQLDLSIDRSLSFELEGFDGRTSSAQAVELDLIFLQRTFRGRFLLIDQSIGILGRNVLNRLALLFDGPNSSWSEQRSVRE